MKAPLSLQLLKVNLKCQKQCRKSAISYYKQCIKDKLPEETRLRYYGEIKQAEKYISDFEIGIKKLEK